MEETRTAYERSEEILNPDDFVKSLKGLHDYAQAIAGANGHAKVMHAGSYYRLFSKVVDSYLNMWEKTED